MARTKDRSLAELRFIRREVSALFARAKSNGRLRKEMLAVLQEAGDFLTNAIRKPRASRRRQA